MIGLDTGHLVYNYGTKLQAYAMQTLLEQNGEKCEIIQWHTKDFKFLNPLVDEIKRIKKIYTGYRFNIKYWYRVYRRYRAFDRFNKKFHIKKYYGTFQQMKKNTNIYDKVFCGSDQAWLPGNVEKKWYTLEFCNDDIFKAAYAPSFGIDYIDEAYRERYKAFLSRLNFISVREISGKKLIMDLIGKEVPVVLDPTLLLRRNTWDELKADSKIVIPKENYIFCYLLGTNKQHREEIIKLKERYGCKIVNLQHFSGYCPADDGFGDINLYDVAPQDFIALIENAKYVCTDSFHCTAFSIHYHKEFVVFHRFKKSDNGSTNTRLYSLLSQLGLEKCIVEDGTNVEIQSVDYECVDNKLEKLRQISAQAMQMALEGKRNV